MPIRLLLASVLLAPLQAHACSPCRSMVLAGVFDAHFGLRALMLTVPVLLMLAFALWLYRSQETSR